MSRLIIFVLAVAGYVAVLVWCLVPLVRRPTRRWSAWLRVPIGLLLLLAIGASGWPPLAWPIALPIAAFNEQAASDFMAVAAFPLTLPTYVLNIRDRANATATVVEVSYPIAIAGVRYVPVARTACTTRRELVSDKGLAIVSVKSITAASGGEFVAQAGDAIVVLDHSYSVCEMALRGRLQPGPWPDFQPGDKSFLIVYVLRGEADKTRLYRIADYPSANRGVVVVDDIVLESPKIIRIDPMPARDVISLDVLWPMALGREWRLPERLRAYTEFPGRAGRCVMFVTVFMDVQRGTQKVERSRTVDLMGIPAAQRPAICRDELPNIPPVELRLTPVAD